MDLRTVLLSRTDMHLFFSLNSLSYYFFLLHAGFEVWSKLQKLEILDLSYNGELDESSIASLAAVSSLRSLFLHWNAFSSNLTIQRKLLRSLIMRTIFSIFLALFVPTTSCKSFLIVYLVYCTELSTMKLHTLDLGHNNIHGTLPTGKCDAFIYLMYIYYTQGCGVVALCE
jgi:hypothetical protein